MAMHVGSSHGCLLSTILLFINNCDNISWDSLKEVLFKYAEDSTLLCLISKNDDSKYQKKVAELIKWSKRNHQSLNVCKTKELCYYVLVSGSLLYCIWFQVTTNSADSRNSNVNLLDSNFPGSRTNHVMIPMLIPILLIHVIPMLMPILMIHVILIHIIPILFIHVMSIRVNHAITPMLIPILLIQVTPMLIPIVLINVMSLHIIPILPIQVLSIYLIQFCWATQ